MITKEDLLARRAALENEIAGHRNVQACCSADIERLNVQRERANALENAAGGHIQEINHWLGVLTAADPPQEKTQ